MAQAEPARRLLSPRCSSFRVEGHSPAFSQRRTAAPLPPRRSNAGLSDTILSGLRRRWAGAAAAYLHLCTVIVEVDLKLRGVLWMNCHAKRLECVQLAGAVIRQGRFESGSKLHALQTLHAVRLRLCVGSVAYYRLNGSRQAGAQFVAAEADFLDRDRLEAKFPGGRVTPEREVRGPGWVAGRADE